MLGTFNHDPPASTSTRTSCDDLSIEECERLVLSPPPVPMNLDAACAAINAAARRSNSSRTHSVQTQPTDGWGEPHLSCQDISKSDLKPIPPQDIGSHNKSRRWTRFLCCFSNHGCAQSERVASSTSKYQKSAPSVNHTDTPHLGVTESFTKKRKRLKIWPFRKIDRTCEIDSSKQPQIPNADSQRSPNASHSVSEPETGHNTLTCPPCRPVLPTSVLNALASSRPSVSTSSSTAVFREHDPLTSSNGSPSVPLIPPLAKKSLFSATLSRTSSLKPHDAGRGAREHLPMGDSHSFTRLADEHNEHVEEQLQRINHIASWISRDVVDHMPSGDVEPHGYHIDTDQNGGQRDSSSENLDTMTPGMDLLGEIPIDCANKKCLVLDLDETLVHSWFKYVDNASFVVPVDLDGVKHQIYVCKRPHLDEFLRAVSILFECVMFTASLRKYADPVCDHIDQSSCFRHRLFREACVYHQNNLIKDLSRLGRDIDQVCILDNSPVSFLFQPNNALQVVSWFDDPNDCALLELIPYLTGLAQSNTVVDYLREFQPPASAAIAQPPTPSWFFLFDSGAPQELDENEGSEHLEDVGYEYSEEEAVLSPHFHPPVPLHSSNASALIRSYLTQMDPQSNTRLVQNRVNAYPLSLTGSCASPAALTSDCERGCTGRLVTMTEMRNSQI